jgi:hypothetical protein
MFLKIIVGLDLEPSKDLSISLFDLAIAPGMRHGGETELDVSHPIYKNINRAIIYAPGSSHAYIQQNHQDITTRISK